jgi:hypothetical protein
VTGQVARHHYDLHKPLPLEVMCLLLKNWELWGGLKSKQQQTRRRPKSNRGRNRSLRFCTLLESPRKKKCLHLHCIDSWKRGSPRPHNPKKCICSLMSRGRGSNYYYLHCGICLCPRHCGFGLFPVQVLNHTAKGFLPLVLNVVGQEN